MEIADNVSAAIATVREEWNKAEATMKIAEQVNSEIIIPSVLELRYSGRKVIEALQFIEAQEPEKANEILQDALLDCYRARHDALDAAISKMVADLASARNHLGAKALLDHFPDYVELTTLLGDAQDQISISRKKRDDRNAIYSTIETHDLGKILPLFRRFHACEPLLKEAAEEEKRRLYRSEKKATLSLIATVLTIAVMILLALFK